MVAKIASLCVVLIYTMWWNKPLSVNEAVVLQGEWVPELCAFMYICSQTSGTAQSKRLEGDTRVKTLFASLDLYTKSAEVEMLAYSTTDSPNGTPRHTRSPSDPAQTPVLVVQQTPLSSREPDFRLASKRSIADLFNSRQKDAASMTFFERRPRIKDKSLEITSEDPMT